MELMKEVSFIFNIHIPKPEVFFEVFEENCNCFTTAESTKFSPRTEHIAIKYHHFQSFVQNKIIHIYDLLIHKNKQRRFSLSHLTENYSSI